MSGEKAWTEAVAKIDGCKVSRGGCDPEPAISCSGDQVTQETIIELLSVLRQFKTQPDGWLKVKTLTIYETPLTTFDLTAFAKSNFNSLSISNNGLLASIKGSIRGSDKIKVKSLHISFNPKLNDDGFSETLENFDADTLYNLNLWGMKIQGSRRNELGQVSEFLPGLSAFRNLGSLELAMNEIEQVGGGQFQKNNKISFLNFNKNPIKRIEKDAFKMEEIDPSDEFFKGYNSLVIRLSECELTNQVFVDGQLDWPNQREVHLQIMDNKLDSLPAAIFQSLLNAHEQNEIVASDNPIVLDEKIKWLTDNKRKYEKRVDFQGFSKN